MRKGKEARGRRRKEIGKGASTLLNYSHILGVNFSDHCALSADMLQLHCSHIETGFLQPQGTTAHREWGKLRSCSLQGCQSERAKTNEHVKNIIPKLCLLHNAGVCYIAT